MRKPSICLAYTLFYCLFWHHAVAANVEASSKALELSVNLGASQFTLGDSQFQVTETEWDNLRQSNNPWVAQWGAGINYRFPLKNRESLTINWLPDLAAGINFYYQSHDSFNAYTSGQIEQYQDPAFSNYRYELDVTTQRLMFDVALTLAQVQKANLFVIGGVGYGFATVSYKDLPDLGVANGALLLNDKGQQKVTSEIGIGLNYQSGEKTKYFIEYLYNYFGKVSTGNTGFLNGIPSTISPATFNLQSNSIIVGLTMKIS